MLQRNGAGGTALYRQKIADTQGLVGQTMNTVHSFARELRPAMLDELGLLPALRSYLKGFAERTGVRVQFHGRVEAENLNSEQKTVLYRIAQESLTNVAKHAQASRVNVTVGELNYAVEIQIRNTVKHSAPNQTHRTR